METITELLYGPGQPMPGSAMTDEQALVFARKRFPHSEFCLVRHWRWIDCGFHAIRPPSPLSSGQAFHGHLATCSTAIRPGSRSAATQGLHC